MEEPMRQIVRNAGDEPSVVALTALLTAKGTSVSMLRQANMVTHDRNGRFGSD